MIQLRQALRHFRHGPKLVTRLEADAIRDARPYLWAGQPIARRRLLPMGRSVCGAVIILAMFLHQGADNWFFLAFGLALGTSLPLLIVLDWYETEYLVTSSALLLRPGTWTRTTLQFDLAAIEECRVHEPYPGLLPGITDVHLEGPALAMPGGPRPAKVWLRGMPADQAYLLLALIDRLQTPDDARSRAEPVVDAAPT